MRSLPLTMLVAFLLTGCASSTPQWVTSLPPPRVDCGTCAALDCPETLAPPIPKDAKGEADPDDVGEVALTASGTYRKCRLCALGHERCLEDERKAGKIR